MARRPIASVFLLLPSLACAADSDAPVASHTVVDSASVIIVESARPRLAGEDAWRVAREPTTIFGYHTDERRGMGQAGWGVVLSDGGVVGIEYTTSELKYFGPDGELRRAVGGRGEGPGEFRSLVQFWRLPGDTVVAYDRGLRRVSRWSADGELLGSVSLSSTGFIPQVVGLRPGGGFLGMLQVPPDWGAPEGTVMSVDETFSELSPEGESGEAWATLPGDRVKAMRYDGEPVMGPVYGAFSPASVYTSGGGHIYHGFSDRYEIKVVEGPEGVGRIIRWAGPDRPLTRDILDTRLEAERKAVAERFPEELPETERRQAEADYPDELPAFDWLLVDALGYLWVRSVWLTGQDAVTWSVFDPEGVWVTDVEVPAQQRPSTFDIGADYVLIREADEVGLPYYAKYDLERR